MAGLTSEQTDAIDNLHQASSNFIARSDEFARAFAQEPAMAPILGLLVSLSTAIANMDGRIERGKKDI